MGVHRIHEEQSFIGNVFGLVISPNNTDSTSNFVEVVRSKKTTAAEEEASNLHIPDLCSNALPLHQSSRSIVEKPLNRSLPGVSVEQRIMSMSRRKPDLNVFRVSIFLILSHHLFALFAIPFPGAHFLPKNCNSISHHLMLLQNDSILLFLLCFVRGSDFIL